MLKQTKNLLVGLVTLATLITGTTANAAPVTWDGAGGGNGGDGVNWSDPLNWDTSAIPTAADDVFIGAASTVDAAFTILSLTQTASGAMSNSGGSLTAATFTKTGGGPQINVPITLTASTTFNATIGGGWSVNGLISETGSQKITLIGGDQLRLTSNNTFSGGIDVENGNLRFQDNALGSGPIVLGANGGGAGNGNLFTDQNGTYTNSTNTVTVKAGAGNRDLFNQLSPASVSLPLVFALEKDLRIRMGTSDAVTLTGATSGVGGFNIVDDGTVTTAWQVNLDGTYAHTGTTSVTGNGTATLSTSLATGNLIIGGVSSTGAILDGAGTINFSDGDLIDVNNAGTLDASSLQFDLTALTTQTATLVDYSDSGAFTGPGSLNDLLNSASQDLGWFLQDTGTQVIASIPQVPEPSTLGLLLIGLVGASMARRRKTARS